MIDFANKKRRKMICTPKVGQTFGVHIISAVFFYALCAS